MRVNLVLIGPPGCGKGTQALRLARRFGVPHISTGDILRGAVREGSPIGRQVGALIAAGGLVDDALITALVDRRLRQPDTAGGVILDGYPRTVVQAQSLDEMRGSDEVFVAVVEVPDDAIVRRLSSRRVCESCGITQSVSDADLPRESCPYCGGDLIRRADDDAEVVRRRLATYASLAGPLIGYYRDRPSFFAVDGLRAPDEVTASLIKAIERCLP